MGWFNHQLAYVDPLKQIRWYWSWCTFATQKLEVRCQDDASFQVIPYQSQNCWTQLSTSASFQTPSNHTSAKWHDSFLSPFSQHGLHLADPVGPFMVPIPIIRLRLHGGWPWEPCELLHFQGLPGTLGCCGVTGTPTLMNHLNRLDGSGGCFCCFSLVHFFFSGFSGLHTLYDLWEWKMKGVKGIEVLQLNLQSAEMDGVKENPSFAWRSISFLTGKNKRRISTWKKASCHKYDVVLRMHCLDPMVFEVLRLNKERMIQRLRMPTLSVHGNPMFHRGKAMPTYLLEFLTSSESLGNINGVIKNPKQWDSPIWSEWKLDFRKKMTLG